VIDGSYKISSQLNLNIGQTNTIRKYNSKAAANYTWNNDEYRSRLYSYLSYRISEKLNVRAGGAWQYASMSDKAQQKNYYDSFQPLLRINYALSDFFNINGRYSISSVFPSLYELGDNPYQIDSLMIGVGNPLLKPAYRHQASLEITLGDIFTISPQYSSSERAILPIYEQRSSLYYQTYQNMQSREFAMVFNLNTPLGDYFEVSAALAYHYQTLKYQNLENSYNTWLGNFMVSFYHPELTFGVDLEYDRAMDKVALIQGYRMTGIDTWQLTVYKQFWKRRIQLMVSYLPPISWGRRTSQTNIIETTFYNQVESFGLNTYNNMLFMRLSIRLNAGKKALKKLKER
jgi:hypothetical protein